jgi:hypothetical protein
MRSSAVRVLITALAVTAGCLPAVHPTPPPATAPAKAVALSGASVMIGAGDIAGCSQNNDFATANLVDSVLKADSVAKVTDAVFTLGDNAYASGTTAQFAECFTPTWGDPAKRIMSRIHPTPGNHEYESVGATPYFKYFGSKAGEPGLGYYSYDVGTWHVVVLNSEIVLLGSFSDADRAAQAAWLLKDLTDHKAQKCTLAYWHEPRFSSGYHGSDLRFAPIWRILFDNGVDLVLNGHDHDYERFAPQTVEGVADSTGITEIVAGTGGEELRGFGGHAIRNSVFRVEGHAGVLVLTLGSAEYRSAFLDAGGTVWDPSGGKCR